VFLRTLTTCNTAILAKYMKRANTRSNVLDATNPGDEAWRFLWFDHDINDNSSSLTNAGTHRVLRCHDPIKRWPSMLLPDTYHGLAYDHLNYRGITGEIGIFLALLALSMQPERLSQELLNLVQNGEWKTHRRTHGRR
jgi:hypothetical protein